MRDENSSGGGAGGLEALLSEVLSRLEGLDELKEQVSSFEKAQKKSFSSLKKVQDKRFSALEKAQSELKDRVSAQETVLNFLKFQGTHSSGPGYYGSRSVTLVPTGTGFTDPPDRWEPEHPFRR